MRRRSRRHDPCCDRDTFDHRSRTSAHAARLGDALRALAWKYLRLALQRPRPPCARARADPDERRCARVNATWPGSIRLGRDRARAGRPCARAPCRHAKPPSAGLRGATRRTILTRGVASNSRRQCRATPLRHRTPGSAGSGSDEQRDPARRGSSPRRRCFLLGRRAKRAAPRTGAPSDTPSARDQARTELRG